MRLDHLLSREPVLWGAIGALACVVGVLVVFLCSHVFTALLWGGGCGCVFWVGYKSVSRHAVGFTFNTVLASVTCVVVVGLRSRLGCLSLGCGCVWWVVCDLYSGCEHICSVLFFVFCLVLLGIRWMPWHQELMKDVAACDMPRGAGERALLSEGVRMGEPNLGCAGLPSSERV